LKKILSIIFFINFFFLLSCDNKEIKVNAQKNHLNEFEELHKKLNDSSLSFKDRLKLNDSAVKLLIREVRKSDLKNLNDLINIYKLNN